MIGLPTLNSLDRAATTRIWLAVQPADMRCGFDRLAELAQAVTDQNPMDGHLFLFRGRLVDDVFCRLHHAVHRDRGLVVLDER